MGWLADLSLTGLLGLTALVLLAAVVVLAAVAVSALRHWHAAERGRVRAETEKRDQAAEAVHMVARLEAELRDERTLRATVEQALLQVKAQTDPLLGVDLRRLQAGDVTPGDITECDQ